MPESIDVKNWMSGDPIAVEPGASALEALDLMQNHGIHHLPVLDAERCVVGVLSLDDLRAAFPFSIRLGTSVSPEERELAREWSVAEAMTHAPETVRESTALSEAAQRMAAEQISCLPVVDEDGRLAGMLSESDVLQALVTALWSNDLRERRAGGEFGDLVASLKRERTAISQRLDVLHATEREISENIHDTPGDSADRGAAQREVSITERFDEFSARRLDAIDRALDRAAQGNFGVCGRCGGAIPAARLRALPGATQCVACARFVEGEFEPEVLFERMPGGRDDTGRQELGDLVYTRFGEGRLLRQVPFGTCGYCGDVEGRLDPDQDTVVCGNDDCGNPLSDVLERAIVQVEEREVFVDPSELRPVDAAPYD